ncbi:hypothetical protein GQ53DRAFT_740756 [Thozetella sp. PMI_491]|nr:hypothetical protein GQ53DRAFT_740756 [Thozetella sp. PMI_491]
MADTSSQEAAPAVRSQAAPVSVPPLLMSTEFYIGCGTLTVDPRARKWLGIYYPLFDDIHLPRGRKDWGERMETAAERETFEETGFRSRLLPSYMGTRSTPPTLASSDPTHRYHAALKAAQLLEGGDLLADGVKLTEPFALLPHFQTNGALAVVFFFLGVADSTAERVPGEESGQQEEEDYEPIWYDYDTMPPHIREGYQPIVERGVQLAETLAEREGVEGMLKGVQGYWERPTTPS